MLILEISGNLAAILAITWPLTWYDAEGINKSNFIFFDLNKKM